jgi:hypothetical protein
LQKAVQESLEEAAKAGSVQAGHENEEAKQKMLHKLIKRRFNVKSVLRDGNCLFRSFVAAQKLYNGEQLTVQELRNSVAAHLIQKIEAEGGIPHAPYSFFVKNHQDEFVLSDVLQGVRGEEAAWKKSEIEEAAGGKKKKKRQQIDNGKTPDLASKPNCYTLAESGGWGWGSRLEPKGLHPKT